MPRVPKEDMQDWEPKRKRKQMLRRRIYAFFILFFGIIILIAGFLALFHTLEIKVTGLTYGSETETVAWLKADKGSSNTLYLKYKYGSGKKLLPFMDKVQISLSKPWGVTVKVTEKPIVGAIQSDAGYYCFDKEGLVVLVSQTPAEGTAIVEGIAIQGAKLYKNLDVSDASVFGELADMAQMMKSCALTPDKIICDGKNITAVFGTITVNLGSDNIKNRMLQIPPILEKIAGQSGTVHLEYYNENNRKISFQKTAEPEPDAAGEDTSSDGSDDSYVNDDSDDYDNNYDDSSDSRDSDTEEGSDDSQSVDNTGDEQ